MLLSATGGFGARAFEVASQQMGLSESVLELVADCLREHPLILATPQP